LEMRALNADEVKRLLSCAAEPENGALVMVAVHAGLRRSELPGLQWEDISLDLVRLHVVRSLHNVARHRRGPKYHNSRP